MRTTFHLIANQLLLQLGPSSKHLATLNLFAYETIEAFNANKSSYLELKPAQLKKLQLLTIADMASKSRVVTYDEIMTKLNIKDIR